MDRIRHLIAVLPLAATLTLTSCFSSPLNGSSDDTPATVAPTSQGTGSTSARTTAAASIALPDPVSGTYNGQTVTMEYTVLTNQDISLFNSGSFHNGYAQVLFQEKGGEAEIGYVDTQGDRLSEPPETQSVQESAVESIPDITYGDPDTGLGLLNEKGQPLTEPIFGWISGFSDGYSFASLLEGEHRQVLIDRSGNIRTILPDDCIGAYLLEDGFVVCRFALSNAYEYGLYTEAGFPVGSRRYQSIGSFEDGLSPIVANGRLGLIDREGNLVIEPALPVDTDTHMPRDMENGYFLTALDGKLGIIRVTRA